MGDWSTPRQAQSVKMRGAPMVSSEDSAWDVPPSIFGTRAGGPTVQRLVLGGQLHRLRESRGISAEQAAEADPGLPLQDQPDGTRPGRLQGARRERPADALRGDRQRGARRPAEPGPGGQHARLVARLLGRHADLAGAVRGPGGRGLGAPDLRGPVRPRAAADRGVRAGADPPRLRGQRGRDRPPGRAAGQPPGGPGRPEPAAAVGRGGRGRAAPPGGRPRGGAQAACST